MSEVFLAGPGLSVQSFYAHTFHQAANMLAAHRKACSIKLILQHASTHEGVLKVQLVNAAHQRQVVDVKRFWPIIDTAATDANQLGLPFDRKSMFAVDYRFALSNPTLVSALSKKSFSSVN